MSVTTHNTSSFIEKLKEISESTTLEEVYELAEECIVDINTLESDVNNIEQVLATSHGRQRLMLWYLVDKLSKLNVLFLDALRPRLLSWATNYCLPIAESKEYNEFSTILHRSFTVLFGAPLVSLIDMQLKNNISETTTGLSDNEDIKSAPLQSETQSNTKTLSTLPSPSALPSAENHQALSLHTTSLRSVGGFMTKAVATQRPAAIRHRLQVKTIDSQMAMNVASSYAPARPVEIAVPALTRDQDAPDGYMKALPADYTESYTHARRKRLREVMERNRAIYNKQQEAKLLQRVRAREGLASTELSERNDDIDGDNKTSNNSSNHNEVNNKAKGCNLVKAAVSDNMNEIAALMHNEASDIAVVNLADSTDNRHGESNNNINNTNNTNSSLSTGSTKLSHSSAIDTFDDVQMPVELPRDEYGIRKGNFPLGVRFIRDAIRACGGAVELDVLVNRISTLSNRAVLSQFGNVREFLLIHSPTFRVVMEDGQWVVRLTNPSNVMQQTSYDEEFTWKSMTCPACSKIVKGRNFARHYNSRKCITAQMALGLQGDYVDRGPIAELAFCAKWIISNQERGCLDDEDIDTFTHAMWRSAQVRRFRLASPRQFAPVLKALRVIRDEWLQRKGVSEVNDVVVDSTDCSIVHLLQILGQSIHRLPIAWIETGDIVDLCHRFTYHVLPPFNPPPRPADPRTSLTNEYPGFLLCESDIDDEDEPSGDDDEFSDDDAPTFTFAPPVEIAESLFTAGFERDTRRLQHRMRTAPPMILQHVLQTDRVKTQAEMYREVQTGINATLPTSASSTNTSKYTSI